ncbi:MAG TPA: NAD-dependent epimerase/dehydratase family protein, partial [Flavobacteriales bacterium]|nr:NAD-dependent epimerase/dehydratase family protein [Flavobacteriales bacterium]
IYASSASVYGDGKEFEEIRENENPINLYAFSKYLFDQLVRQKITDNKIQISESIVSGEHFKSVDHAGKFKAIHMASSGYYTKQTISNKRPSKLVEFN